MGVVFRLGCWTLPVMAYIMNKLKGNTVCGFLIFGTLDSGGLERLRESGLDIAIIWIAVLAMFLAIGYYIIKKIRANPVQKELPTNKWLAKCRELNSQGELSDEEFRTIKTALAAQLQDELKDNGEKG
jgi:uncharacterized membrane protein